MISCGNCCPSAGIRGKWGIWSSNRSFSLSLFDSSISSSAISFSSSSAISFSSSSSISSSKVFPPDETKATVLRKEEGRINSDDANWTNLYNTSERQSNVASPHYLENLNYSNYSPRFQEMDDKGLVEGKLSSQIGLGPRVLPFEFIALEACLEATCSCLDNEARTLEQEAHLVLDKLTTKISTLNLEHVHQIKSRLVAITGIVQKVSDELEHLLDDDEDMAEMYLTDKFTQQRLDGSSSLSSLNDGDGMGEGAFRSDIEDDRIQAEISSKANDCPNNDEAGLPHFEMIANSVVMNYVTIEDGCSIQGSVICSNVHLQDRVVPKDCQVGAGYVITARSEYKSESLARKEKPTQ